MNRRIALQIAIAGSVLLFAGASSAGAHQIWSVNQAQAAETHARDAATTALTEAHAQGLVAIQVRDLSARMEAVSRMEPPQGNPLWSNAQTSFYDRQARAYTRLAQSVKTRIRVVTAAKRRSEQVQLAAVETDLASGRGLGLTLGVHSGFAKTLEERVSRARTVSQLERLGTLVARLDAGIRSDVARRRAALTAVESAGGGTTSGIQQLGQTDVQSLQSDLSLLLLFKHVSSSPAESVSTSAAALAAATTPLAAASSVLRLRALETQVSGEFSRVVPDKVIVVSTEDQTATAYEGGKVVLSTPVTTGGPELPTDHGVFHIFEKISPFVFHSPFPLGSPYYYDPTPVQFWMPFDGNEGLHDASWRSNFGPGSNLAPTDLGNGNVILGTHGCVNLPYDAAQFIWNWAPLGTTVVVT